MDELLKKYVEGNCSLDELNEVVDLLRSGKIPPDGLKWMKHQWYSTENSVDNIDDSIDFDSVLYKIHHDVNLIESKQERGRFTKVRKIYLRIQAAAAIAIIAFLSLSIWYAGKNGIFQKESFYTVSSVRGQSSKIAMPDGSEIWLNGKSSVFYNSSFGVDNRELSLVGEGFFNVQKNAELPFIVKVGSTKITALGTSFNIDAYRGEDNVLVTLETGRILVESNNRKTEVTPGQQVVVAQNGFKVYSVDTELFTSWRNGQIVFKDETLFSITSQLEKMYDVQFVYNSDTLKSFRYRGTIRLDNSVLKALEMLKLSTGIKYKVEESKVFLDQ